MQYLNAIGACICD
jgi:hypothetical protein